MFMKMYASMQVFSHITSVRFANISDQGIKVDFSCEAIFMKTNAKIVLAFTSAQCNQCI